jgi:polyvinyl alcohol dehydrogenase (cytochrome)
MTRSDLRPLLVGVSAVIVAVGAADVAWGQDGPPSMRPLASSGPATFTENGLMLFESKCMSCHGNPKAERAPPPQALRAMPPERIYAALTSGPMKAVGDTLTDVQRRQVAESTAGRLMGTGQSGEASAMPNRCPTTPPMTDPANGAHWNGWGVDGSNTRYQPEPGLTAADLPRLKLKWAFGLPGSTSAYGQPTLASGRVFVGTDMGYVYALDAKTGCVHWSFKAKASVRNSILIEPLKSAGKMRYAAYFGDLKANVYAIDASTGALIWTRHVDEHVSARITAAPAFYGNRLFVPVSSWESSSAKSIDYACCTFVGNVVALDASTGAPLWKRYVFDERPKPVRKNSKGVQLYAPAGSAVWNTPTVDPRRDAVYFGTGDASTWPAPPTADSVMAVSMATGKLLWTFQVHKGDASLVGCWGEGITDNCPKEEGPDWDVPASPILRTLSDGRRELIVGTKPGDILALDPDHKGAQVWRMNVNGPDLAAPGPPDFKKPPMKGVLFGGAADPDTAYFGLQGGGMAAVRLADGKLLWFSPLGWTPGGRQSYQAATTAIPGAAIVGGTDGHLVAVSAADGHTLWDYDTGRSFETVNKVPANGGSFGSAGPTVAGGMLFAGSGYAVIFTRPGNALLAFAPE